MTLLGEWIDAQYRRSAAAMLRSVSPVAIVKSRPGFDQVIRPRRGAIVASPILGAYDPDPDYFFHWYRDSAIVVDALRLLCADPGLQLDTRRQFGDFVDFSLSLQTLDGGALAASTGWRTRVESSFTKFLRTPEDLSTVRDATVWADTRVNPDGSLDISQWPRPQYDGTALRALTLLRWRHDPGCDARLRACMETLLLQDLKRVLCHANEACYDIWEEEFGQHYYTLRVTAAALEAGADWLEEIGQFLEAQRLRTRGGDLLDQLDGYWLPGPGYYRSRVLETGLISTKELDMSVVLAAVHAASTQARHSVHDPRMQSTLSRLEEMFMRLYPINHSRPAGRGPAMGRYEGDVYFSGGAYYFSTLGAAEFCFRASIGAASPASFIDRGNAFLEMVRAYAPPAGELAEQFDKTTGEPRSARDLAWSHAAFISCIAARRNAVAGALIPGTAPLHQGAAFGSTS